MASFSQPRILTFQADASITKGKAVKISSTDKKLVTVCSATTDESVGIVQSAPTASADLVEVAIQGGGALALLGGSVTHGQFLVATTDGSLIKASASADKIIARAMQDGSSGDLIGVEVVYAFAVAAES